jgi:hypothetical protein
VRSACIDRFGVICGLFAGLASLGISASLQAQDRAPGKPDDLFGITHVWTVHLKVTKEGWAGMQPIRPSQGGQKPLLARILDALIKPPATQPATRPTTEPSTRPQPLLARIRPNSFQISYTYVPAAIEFEGQTFSNVGLRFKGNISYTTNENTLHRPFKIDFDRFLAGQKFCDLHTINLHNNSIDPTQMREALVYDIYRKAGVPAPRTAYALVYLTVEGMYDHEYLGLYTLTEEVDKRFLRKHLGSDDGMLLKPEANGGLPYLGDNWAAYEQRMRPHSPPTTQATRRYIELTKLIHKADEKEFRQRIDSFIDVDAFLKFLAVTAGVQWGQFPGDRPQFLPLHGQPGWPDSLGAVGCASVAGLRVCPHGHAPAAD